MKSKGLRTLIAGLLSMVLVCSVGACQPKQSDEPNTGGPETPTSAPTTAPTTAPSTAPSTETRETIDHGNGPRDDMDTTETTGPAARSRGAMPNMK